MWGLTAFNSAPYASGTIATSVSPLIPHQRASAVRRGGLRTFVRKTGRVIMLFYPPHHFVALPSMGGELLAPFAPNGYKSQEFLFYIKTRQNKNFKTFILFI